MKLKKILFWPLFFINIIIIIFFSLLVFFLAFGIPGQASYTKTIVPTTSEIKEKVPVWIPLRLKISKLNIDALIVPVGLTPDGAMDSTKGPYDVAWYNLWPRPGEQWSAVVAGHYGKWKNGAVSVFNTLDTLIKGDKISIVDDKGVIISFIVRESKIYPLDADASDVFYSTDGQSHLNLVTCIQDKITKKYPNRLVVFTDKEILTGAK